MPILQSEEYCLSMAAHWVGEWRVDLGDGESSDADEFCAFTGSAGNAGYDTGSGVSKANV